MPLPIDFIRATLAVLAVIFAYFFGRYAVRSRQGRARQSLVLTWGFRLAASLLAVFWTRQFDLIAIMALIFAGASLGAGIWMELHPKQEPDLTKTMFPEE